MENIELNIALEYLENGLYKKSLDILLNLINNNVINPTVIKLVLKIYLTFKSWVEANKYIDLLIIIEPTIENYYIKFNILKNIANTELLEQYLNSIPKLETFNNLISEIKSTIPKYSKQELDSIINSTQDTKEIKISKLMNLFENTYLHSIEDYCKLIGETNPKNILMDPKKEFRYFCYNYLDLIKKIDIPDIPVNNFKEAILIEFRPMAHLEFLIRNAVIKLKSDWSHTIVCGNLNYEYMKSLCANISPNIKVIKIDYDNLTPFEYSKLLASVDFWKLFNGDKILLYQEDTCIFKSNVDDFLIWDYIGAPWPPHDNNNKNNVGNGGFSLRTKKCMIDTINKISIEKAQYNREYKETPPEDVYFSKSMIDYNIGNVADFISGYLFSHECYINEDAFGAHCFFLYNREWKKIMYDKIIIDLVTRSINKKSQDPNEVL